MHESHYNNSGRCSESSSSSSSSRTRRVHLSLTSSTDTQMPQLIDRHLSLERMITVWSFLMEPTGRSCCWILLRLLAAVADAVSFDAVGSIDGGSEAVPCIHDGHLKTERNWFGYLANISVANTGRLTFEFSYPAEKCCQNILFYSEDQISIISARMNCWQKEYLLRPEDDQILRLTPRFSWSGCHMTHPNGKPTYVCEGGRSFTVEQQQQQQLQLRQASSTSGLPGVSARTALTTWYIAVSNCATLQGLDLQYRLVIHGHIGECPYPSSTLSNPRTVLMPRDSPSSSEPASSDAVCVLDGDLNSTSNWYGFLVNASFVRGGGFRYRFSYPYHMQVQNVLLYGETDLMRLEWLQNCWQKEAVFPSWKMQEQILDLSVRSSRNGCISKNVTTDTAGGRTLLCQGERRYDDPRTVLFAVNNCRSTNGLILNYHLEIYGYSNVLNCTNRATQLLVDPLNSTIGPESMDSTSTTSSPSSSLPSSPSPSPSSSPPSSSSSSSELVSSDAACILDCGLSSTLLFWLSLSLVYITTGTGSYSCLF